MLMILSCFYLDTLEAIGVGALLQPARIEAGKRYVYLGSAQA